MNRQPKTRKKAYQTQEFKTAIQKIWNAGNIQ